LRNSILIFLLFFTGLFTGKAQIFSWKNPNIPQDSIKKDSILAAKFERDIFAKDTMDFVKTSNRIIVDEAVLAKNDKICFSRQWF
jgi:hypothetical protein